MHVDLNYLIPGRISVSCLLPIALQSPSALLEHLGLLGLGLVRRSCALQGLLALHASGLCVVHLLHHLLCLCSSHHCMLAGLQS